MSVLRALYRYGVVGSFLRPAALKQARLDFAEGKITREELTAVGEFRRGSWRLDFMWAFDGVGHHPTKTGLRFRDENAIERIRKASKFIPLDRLCLSPQCGFASCELGNKLTEEEQWAKAALGRDIAKEVWSE